VFAVAKAVSAATRVDVVVGALLDEVMGPLGHAAACVFLLDATGERLELAAQRGLSPSAVAALSALSLDGAALPSRAAATRSPQLREPAHAAAGEGGDWAVPPSGSVLAGALEGAAGPAAPGVRPDWGSVSPRPR
jgi:hypothetical protein